MYFGPLADKAAIIYFSGLGCSPDAKAAASPRFNVAEWLIEMTGGGTKGVAAEGRDFAAAFAESPAKREADEALAMLLPPGDASSLAKHREDSETATPFWYSFWILFSYRGMRNYTNSDYMGPRVGEKFMLAFIIFSLYLGVASKTDPASVQTTAAVLFLGAPLLPLPSLTPHCRPTACLGLWPADATLLFCTAAALR